MNKTADNLEWASLGGSFKLAQRSDKFKLGTDSVLLSYFSNIKPKYKLVDLCSGTGAVGYLAFLRYNTAKTIFVDCDEDMTELSKLTASENGVDDRFLHITKDVYNINNSIIKNQWADYVTVNPPYFGNNSGKLNKTSDMNNARHCDDDFLNILFQKSYNILKDGGKISVVHRSENLNDICFNMRLNKIEPKRMRLVYSYLEKNASLVLIEGMKNSSSGIICESPLILYESPNVYTEEFKKIEKIQTER